MKNPDRAVTSCIYCRSGKSRRFGDTADILGNSYVIRCCENCHAYFLSPFPSGEMLQRAYDQTYYGPTTQKFVFPFVEKGIDKFRRHRAKNVCKFLPDKARVLDIGCGNGDFLRYVSTFGDHELFGIERDEQAARRAMVKAGIHIQDSVLSENNFPENYFDAVTMFHVFEHLTEPKQTLEIIKKILKPGGILVISVPNIGSWQAGLFRGKWFHMDPPRHLLFFRPDDFAKALRQLGFSLIGQSHYSLEQNPFGWVQSILNMFCKKREALYERLKGNRQYAPEYGSFNMLMQKCFFLLSTPVFVIFSLVESVCRRGATVRFTIKNTKQ